MNQKFIKGLIHTDKQIQPILILSTIIYSLWDWLIDAT